MMGGKLVGLPGFLLPYTVKSRRAEESISIMAAVKLNLADRDQPTQIAVSETFSDRMHR